MPNIYDYTNYRVFLKDFYIEQKAKDARFSYSVFADKAGFKSKTFLFKVMTGEKALSLKKIQTITQALELGKKECEYFDLLVKFNETDSSEKKEQYLIRMMDLREGKTVALRREQYEYFSKWYHAVIRELITQSDFDGDYKRLANSLNPRITPGQTKKSVALLCKLGLIRKTQSGHYEQTQKGLTTGDEVVSFAVRKFQKEMIAISEDALDKISRKHRDISTLTMGISVSGFQKIKGELQQFRKRLTSIANQDEPSNRVYQLNIQFFPVSSLPKDGNAGNEEDDPKSDESKK